MTNGGLTPIYLVWRIEGDGMLVITGQTLLDVCATREVAERVAAADRYGPTHVEERVPTS